MRPSSFLKTTDDRRIILLLSLLLLLWSGALAWMLFKISGKYIFPDFFLPFIIFTSLFVAIYSFNLIDRKLARIIVWLCSLLFASLTGLIILLFRFYQKLQRSISFDDIYAVLQSDSAESVSYIIDNFFSLKASLFCLLGVSCTLTIAACGAGLLRRQWRSRRHHQLKSVFVGVILLGVSIGIMTQLHPTKFIIKGYNQYYADIVDFMSIMQQVSSGLKTDAVKKENGELYVLVIGEAASRDFMSAYSGPATQNTPWLETLKTEDEWFVFSNAYSSSTHTVPVLTAALSDGRHLTGLTFPKGVTLLQSLNDAGFRTYWISNQAILGPWDNPVSALAHQAEHIEFVNKSAQSFNLAGPKPDECLFPIIQRTLLQINSNDNAFIIIHLMGSHSPYTSRYPDKFPRVVCASKGEIGKHDNIKRVNKFEEYLTSIAYTDSVLASLYQMIKESQRPTVFLYFSDHGEDIFSIDGGHELGSFTWHKARIPMFMWLSESYRKRYPARVDVLRKHVDKIFTNDLIFDLCLGLANIKSKALNNSYDISHDSYSVTLENAIITGSRKIIDDPFLAVQRNAAVDMDKRFALHRANTVFKANQGLRFGISGLEVDLFFMDNNGKTQLWIGHDNTSMTGLSFQDYLSALVRKPDFLWLDIKNMTPDNAESICNELTELDKLFDLKSMALVESDQIRELTNFVKKGWQASFYLPWQAIQDAVKNKNDKFLKQVVERVREHNIPAVSFDLIAEQQNQKKFLPLLSQEILVYGRTLEHSWSEQKLQETISQPELYKKILIPLKTPYDY